MARMLALISAAVALLLAGSAAGAPDSQEHHRACLQASSGGFTWFYDIHTDASGTTLYRWKLNGGWSYVDRNAYAAFHLPEGGRTAWDEGVAFAATMQTRNAWLNSEPTSAATWVYNPYAKQDALTFKTTVRGLPQDYVFRTSQCLDLSPPSATDVPTEPQEPDTPAPAAILHACLEASSGGRTYFYEIHSDRSNDAAGTTFDRYTVAGGVDTFVDSNAFAALRHPDGDLPWAQGIQFTDAMQSRGVWINGVRTTSATIAHESGEDALTFRAGGQSYVFRTSQCRADAPSEPQEPDTDAPACGQGNDCGEYPETDVPNAPQEPDTPQPDADHETAVPNEPQEPDTPQPDDDDYNETDDNETDVPSEPQEPDNSTDDNETPAPEVDVPSEPQEPDTPAPAAILHACLEASSGGVTYYYEIVSDPANDAEGTAFDRYTVDGGVDAFVDSNSFAALRQPDEGLPWEQGIQFTDAMQSRGVWINMERTTSATIEHDAVSGEDTLTFHTTVDGGLQDYIFRTSQCR